MLYAASFLASNNSHNINQHNVCVIEANNHDEAVGFAYRIVYKHFPYSEGWSQHSVKVGTDFNPVKFENIVSANIKK